MSAGTKKSLYRIADGAIVGRLAIGSASGAISAAGCATVDGHHDPDTWYIWEGAPEPRPVMTLVPSATAGAPGSTITLAGIPLGASLAVNGAVPVPVLDDPLMLALHEPGIYRLVVTCWPYQPANLTVTCA